MSGFRVRIVCIETENKDYIFATDKTKTKNNGVIVIPRFCTVCGSVRTSFGDIGEKFTTALLYANCNPGQT